MRTRGFQPGSAVSGTPRLPASKSAAQRWLLVAALARGATTLRGLDPEGDECADVAAARGVAGALGARLTAAAGARELLVEPDRGFEPVPDPEADGAEVAGSTWSVGESATLARLATAVASLGRTPGTQTIVAPAGTLTRRSSAPLFAALRSAGAELACRGLSDGWPALVTAVRIPAALTVERPVSSQEVSALLLAAATAETEVHVRVRGPVPSRPYLDLTLALLRNCAVRVEELPADDGCELLVRGPLLAPARPVDVEPDASAAAVALAAGCLSGGRVEIPGLGRDALQGDVRIAEHLAAFGCVAELRPKGIVGHGAPRHGARLDLAGEPDLAPVLAVVAAAVALRARAGDESARSSLAGLGALPRKESDRLSGLVRGLSATGIDVRATDEALQLAPGVPAVGELHLDAQGDHRMAFAFALLGLVRPGTLVFGPECVAKSWPRFWDELERLGARRLVG